MGIVSFTPFGRGCLSGSTIMTTPYATLKDILDTTKLDFFNFHLNAGLPETWFDWETAGAHHHDHGNPLAPDSIGQEQMYTLEQDTNLLGANGCALAFTQASGVLCLFGTTDLIRVWNDDRVSVRDFQFSETSPLRRSFLPGTFPQVFCTPLMDGNAGGDLESNVMLSVQILSTNSVGFRVQVALDSLGGVAAVSLRLHYIALGVAPGLVAQPAPLLGEAG